MSVVGLLLSTALVAQPSLAAGGPRVDLELVTAPGLPVDGTQRWMGALKALSGTTLRIRSGRAGDATRVENRGTEAAPRYHVVGILTERNRLQLPGAEFSLDERAQIAAWLEKLRLQGLDGVQGKLGAFGLTKEELIAFHERLSEPLAIGTQGRRAGTVAREIVESLALPFEVTPAATQAFHRDESVLDELNGLTRGTALAALLRPLGLVFAPAKDRSRRVLLRISENGESDESWPVGWPPQDSPFRVAPGLFEWITVEIQNTKLADALAAIQKRLDMPFLYDHNGMARYEIEPASSEVSFPKGRAAYKKILDTLLFQAHLTSELRQDERGTPFLWISSVKR